MGDESKVAENVTDETEAVDQTPIQAVMGALVDLEKRRSKCQRSKLTAADAKYNEVLIDALATLVELEKSCSVKEDVSEEKEISNSPTDKKYMSTLLKVERDLSRLKVEIQSSRNTSSIRNGLVPLQESSDDDISQSPQLDWSDTFISHGLCASHKMDDLPRVLRDFFDYITNHGKNDGRQAAMSNSKKNTAARKRGDECFDFIEVRLKSDVHKQDYEINASNLNQIEKPHGQELEEDASIIANFRMFEI